MCHHILHICVLFVFLLFQSFVVTGTNLTLQLMPKALSGEKAENEEPPAESVDYHRDYGKVY